MSADQTGTSLRVTALSLNEAARILSAAAGRRISEGHIRQISEAGQLLRADGTISLIDYVAFLAEEVTHGGD